MFQHLFKLVWNRKKENFLMMIEIFFAFLVMCALTVQAVYYYTNWKQSLGFEYKNIWVISFDPNEGFGWKPENSIRFQSILTEIKSFNEVEAVGALQMVPFDFGNWMSSDSIVGKQIQIYRSEVTDDIAKVMGFEITQGKWYDATDDALNYAPVVVNERLAKAYFPDESPIGKTIFPRFPSPKGKEQNRKPNEKEERIIGVVKDYRKEGELADPKYFAFKRSALAESLASEPPHHLMLRMRSASMSGELEEKIIKRLESMEKTWTFKAQPLSNFHDVRLRKTLTPLLSFAVVGGFLILMVALGLVGVVWQNVVRRTREIGLRRAIGSSANMIFTLVIGELLATTTVAVIAGSLVVIQFPLLNIFEYLKPEVYVTALLISLGFVYSIAVLCALYPSRLATTVPPVLALRYE